MGFIADLSRYDPIEAVDLYDGVILNVEDPGFAAKRDRAVANGKPWGVYSWVYPGGGVGAVDRALVGRGSPLGMWLDYEQGGVAPSDLTAAYGRADQLGVKVGVYTYLYILDSVAGTLGDHPLWLAYYPGQNDGSYVPSMSDQARARGAILHQFTSSNGTRDLNVVVDEARWAAWTGATPAPAPGPVTNEESIDMYIVSDPARPADKYLVGEAGARHIKSTKEYDWLRGKGEWAGNVKVIPVIDQQWFDQLPKIA